MLLSSSSPGNLTAEQQAIGLAAIEAFSFSNPEDAENYAATLPPAPVCQLRWYTDSRHRTSPLGIEYAEAARLLAELIQQHQVAHNAGDADLVATLRDHALLVFQRVDNLHKRLQDEYLSRLSIT